MKAAITHYSLRDCFSAIFDTADTDPVEHIVALTYEFDDQQLVNLLAGRTLDENFQPRSFDLKKISGLAPVVVYDARKTKEANLVPHFLDLLPVRMPGYSCHHSKAYLVATRDRIHLLLGSMNLTHTGLFRNREVFEEFRWSGSETQDLGLLTEFVDLLEQGHADFNSASLGAAVDGLRQRISAWQREGSRRSKYLVVSGYGQTGGLARLKELWRDLAGDAPPRTVFAVSPFFDSGLRGVTLADLLHKEFEGIDSLHLVTDRACMKRLCTRHFGKFGTKTLQLIEQQLTEAECRRIDIANDGATKGGLNLERKLHAKILVIASDDQYLVYVGSANFTCKAWTGDNRELGLAWLERGTAAKFIQQVTTSLSVSNGNQYALLPDIPQEVEEEDDEAYRELKGYPGFVQSIELAESPGPGQFQFKITGSDLEKIVEYDIYWGRETLWFLGGVSAPLFASTLFSRLLGGRNLRFVFKADTTCAYFIPFRHTAELFEKRELHLHESPEDWMQYQLGMGQAGPFDSEEVVPGEESRAPNESVGVEVAREDNPTIRLQRYLSLFGKVEAEFHRRATAVLSETQDERQVRWQSTIATPISTLAAMLARAAVVTPEQVVHRVFQLGELALLAREVWSEGNAGIELSESIVARMPGHNGDPSLQRYIDFCGSKNVN